VAKEKMKGVFCLEGDWETDLNLPTSVWPVLRLLEDIEGIKSVHRHVATHDQLVYYLARWRRYTSYPILYLAFHGHAGVIDMTAETGDDSYVSLDKLGETLAGRCADRVVHFTCCHTLDVPREMLRRFLEQTGAVAVCGYSERVDFVESSALDLLWLTYLQKFSVSPRGLEAAYKRLDRAMSGLIADLGFELVIAGR